MNRNIIDIHCHPALKRWIFPTTHIYKDWKLRFLKFILPHNVVNLDDMQKAGINAAVSVYYLPESNLKAEILKKYLKKLAFVILKTFFFKRIEDIIEDPIDTKRRFAQTQRY